MEIKRLGLLAGLYLLAVFSAQAATITVTETFDDDPAVDNGECSLREAVITANANTQVDGCVRDGTSLTDLIVFAASTDVDLDIGSAASFEMALNTAAEDAAMTGDLDVTDNLRIRGNFVPGSGSDQGTIIASDGNDRVLHVLNNVFLILENLVVAGGGGVATGAGIAVNDGSELTLRETFLFGNNALSNNILGAGGGVYALGDVTVEASAFIGNRVESNGTGNLLGGALAVTGVLVISDSFMTSNELIATGDATASGGAVFAVGDLDISNTLIGNSGITAENGDAHGGHLYYGNADTDQFSMLDSFMLDADIEFNGTGSARGAGLYHAAGQASIRRTTILNNDVQAPQTSSSGAALGGGIFALAPLTLRNTTVAGNEVVSDANAEGGGIYLGGMDASLTMNNVTLFGNTAFKIAGGGLAGGISNVFGASVTVGNSIVAGNSTNGSAPDCRGDLISAGYNLLGDESGCSFMALVASDQVGNSTDPVDPLLEPVIEAGPADIDIIRLVPLATSPVVDAADQSMAMGGSCEDLDQRGAPRPVDNNDDGTAVCEIGALEGAVAVSGGNSGGGSGGGGSSGGGCSLTKGVHRVDPLLPLLASLALLFALRRQRAAHDAPE